jgi:hypothetical protein
MIAPKFVSLALLFTPLAWGISSVSAIAESPTPGSGETNASLLSEENTSSDQTTDVAQNSDDETVAQVRRRQRSVSREPFNPSYFGIGINIGLDDEGVTSLSDTEFAINGKVKLTPNLSFRPGAVIGENASFLVPITYDFTPSGDNFLSSLNLIPYLGGGAFFTTNDDADDDIGGLLTAGLDIPISTRFTANAGLNVGFVDDETEWGLLLGVGFNIPGN